MRKTKYIPEKCAVEGCPGEVRNESWTDHNGYTYWRFICSDCKKKYTFCGKVFADRNGQIKGCIKMPKHDGVHEAENGSVSREM